MNFHVYPCTGYNDTLADKAAIADKIKTSEILTKIGLPLYSLYTCEYARYYQDYSILNMYFLGIFTLSWLLIFRVDMCVAHVSHVGWRYDCLIIYFSKTKTNQDEGDMWEPWYVNTNMLYQKYTQY